ncbi:50S ribosomal protein L22 [Candidatus Kaiserbacteria bacterium CG_4_9_14_3_um_filter_50_16]|uniref:Large ribosomal subunit protein uL22 n=2 Tax=Candidatus Kaiseribacteriota TaxID=1752734 RepID=A0A2M7FBL9_9BACT|nr:MAG: 50S ribosomal protein L22 [Parcubacteria group bacterium CG1_02_50_68]PIS43635.1 MAG: 50S ribosomal protein L22 [Candidatus Kaiserbacteria bacterium CG08_land_8_20_14_0_20_50_21]PIU81842.1 MAG: 50S ribosomal protein L22 [Candidatus Kaiserbacteria bacterium CG06_land_8_20_14_3_00_49_31]PIV86882.1 MAG: 50S ribosomal protein L22 [Candidatus Kaiserbacteria bacterium CG17_big_fil_post_rev_8_21_14_2_50_51_7]PIW96291.1 MAG: 50S ribosomal protein L22 [Candidatus Kaiserbacteria bacterium CG_4_8_
MNHTSLKPQRASAILQSYNQTPRKVRLVTDLVKGKKIPAALAILQFLPKRAAEPITKLIKSAVSTAKKSGENEETLKLQSITVENAGMMKRYMPRAFGRASAIRRRKSRIKITLASTSATTSTSPSSRSMI